MYSSIPPSTQNKFKQQALGAWDVERQKKYLQAASYGTFRVIFQDENTKPQNVPAHHHHPSTNPIIV